MIGDEVVTGDGSKLGRVEQIYLDEETGRPEWAEVKTGMFGNKRSLVPLAVAERAAGGLRVPFDKEQIKGAPHHDPGVELSPQDEAAFFDYYGIPYGGETVTTETGGDSVRSGGGDAMTRSEEELRVGKIRTEVGRARLRKYVVAENVETTIPVAREEVRVEREPITDANMDEALSGPEIAEAEHEVVLHEEQPVVEKRTVPKERVRLAKDVVQKEAVVSEEVRKERIETEGGKTA
ncbi:MAG TPA: PRC and DUF2382 domain-containing protein [Acidimicrobiales bacterium]|nr:PRC and DUF2382 domain-containing protein [Acidimicrobiales bacterium]